MAIRFLEKIITLVFDALALSLAFGLTFWLRYQSGFFPETYNPLLDFSDYLFPGQIITACWIVLFFFCGLYRDWYREGRLDEFYVVCRTVLIGMLLLALITGAPQIIAFAQSGRAAVLFTRTKTVTLLTYGIVTFFLVAVNRFAIHTFLAWLLRKGIGVSKVLIIGANASGAELERDLQRYPQLGHKVAGFIDNDGRKRGSFYGGLPVFGTYADIPAVVKREFIAGIIISRVSNSPQEILRIVEYCGDLHITIHVAPSLSDVVAGHLKTNQIFGTPLMVLLQDHLPPWQAQIKRTIDFLVAAGVLLIGAPLWLTLAALIRLATPGAALFKQERIGQYGKPFIMYKFRSMYIDAEKRTGPTWATENDPRITPIGRFIRKTRFDEIPQFVNVLKGDMSLVGPRPERAFFIEQLKKEIPWYVQRIKMKPGITGWAQVKHKYDASIEDVKQKVMFDLYYFENMSLLLDLKIIFLTLSVVVTGKGAH
ncbi:MAG: sugar transferase [Chitinivibrionales bacterium]|nr:sugar transferase [Chitinivibrionales bacterium]